ncbi:DUF5131 family protein [Dongia sp.]|uniref:DUF5131 family protein n=1 Tax=Dongia sp. TaxID=1977262 RepID=UPI0035ADF8D0
MGANSTIEWTHHTFNPWWGCVRVSPACKNCYAEAWASRFALDVWGPKADRRRFSDAHWKEPLRWNREAAQAGERRRVFCASMADVFEARADLSPERERLWALIQATPQLDWLLLTKRPERIGATVPWQNKWPHNVWIGTSAENQKWADKRIPVLLTYPAVVRFISCEPLLGRLDVAKWLGDQSSRQKINWVIAGGESGRRARPMLPIWVTSLRDQCSLSRTPFFFKQWGNWAPVNEGVAESAGRTVTVSEFSFRRSPKHVAGRLLNGQTWNEIPSQLSHHRKVAE